MKYDHKFIEKKWQKFWEINELFETDIETKKPKFYALDMFPYPSGAGLHVGHPEGYTATDIISRMKRMQGYEVLHPMGWDAFGLPAEQYAIQTGNSPWEFTQKNIKVFKSQLKSLGLSFDWKREINTTDPNYFKNTQWIFAQLYKRGLAKLAKIEVNWSPSLNTVLANEEVIINELGEFVSERDGLPIEKKNMEQWVLKITTYAQKLFDGLETLDWPSSIKKLQKNWFFKKNVNNEYTKELHIRDWVFARQRYWGEPFPIIHLENDEIYLIPENEYPIELPFIENYKFTQDGKPALAKAEEWVNVEINGLKGKRDLNTMPQWAGSNWYYIAYLLREGDSYLNINDPIAKERINKWLPVDLYIGGQEHAVLHLIYARFWHIFLNEIGITNVKEPFKKLFNQGMILGVDGVKMSKSKGNVVNPNDIVDKYGADTLRFYEMFMGALDDDKPWSEKGLINSRNWLNKIFIFFTSVITYGEPSNKIKWEFNRMLENVTNLFNELKFNVAISKMMIFMNFLYKEPILSKEISIYFLQLLSCIAPHISEEIYSIIIGYDGSLINLTWPTKVEVKEEIKKRIIIIQVNGKLRREIFNPDLSNNPSEQEIKNFAKEHISKYLSSDGIKKVFFINNKIINVVT